MQEAPSKTTLTHKGFLTFNSSSNLFQEEQIALKYLSSTKYWEELTMKSLLLSLIYLLSNMYITLMAQYQSSYLNKNKANSQLAQTLSSFSDCNGLIVSLKLKFRILYLRILCSKMFNIHLDSIKLVNKLYLH